MGTTSTKKPILLFLHGVGDGDHDDKWKTRLEKTLEGIGYPALDYVRVSRPSTPTLSKARTTRMLYRV